MHWLEFRVCLQSQRIQTDNKKKSANNASVFLLGRQEVTCSNSAKSCVLSMLTKHGMCVLTMRYACLCWALLLCSFNWNYGIMACLFISNNQYNVEGRCMKEIRCHAQHLCDLRQHSKIALHRHHVSYSQDKIRINIVYYPKAMQQIHTQISRRINLLSRWFNSVTYWSNNLH